MLEDEINSSMKEILEAVKNREMLIAIGNCYVEYFGRAASKLEIGKRMLLIKSDKSFAIHQNKHLRPVNYMMNADIAVKTNSEKQSMEIIASKRNPKETLIVNFYDIDFLKTFSIKDGMDIRLTGSEAELSKQLLNDLSFIEKGMKPFKGEVPFSKGVVDILAEDKEGNLVIIEVKRRKATLDSVSQLRRYTDQLKRIKGREVRGILLAPEITANAFKMLADFSLEFCKFEFEINEKPEIKGFNNKQTTLF